jgi:phosphatidylglycerophosphate synthase
MPAPTSPTSTDHYLYKYIYTPLAENICFIHPNYISIANILITIPLVVAALLNRWSIGAFVAIFALHAFIDCMDGSVARTCSLKSKMGALLDTVSDVLFMVIAGIVAIYMLIQRHGLGSWKTIAIGTLIAMTVLVASVGIDYVHNEDSESISFVNLVHDNTTLIVTGAGAVVWWLIHEA